MLHPDTELRPVSDAVGLGVFATRAIPRGTIVWVLDDLDQRLAPARVARLGPRYEAMLERYGYLDARGGYVLCWDLARWINHSCDTNLLSPGWEIEVAVREIAAGEEITNDYGSLNLERSFVCHCGQRTCRGVIRPEDFDRFAAGWDAEVRETFAAMEGLPQPLWSWVKNKRSVRAAISRPDRLPSVIKHRIQGGSTAVPGRALTFVGR